MKKILLLMIVIVVIGSCSTPESKTIYQTDYFDSITQVVNKIVFPVPPNDLSFSVMKSYSEYTPEQDFANGILYYENSFEADQSLHELDLGYLTNNSKALVYLEVNVIDHGYDNIKNEYTSDAGQIYFRSKDGTEKYSFCLPVFQQYSDGVLILTDDEGKIEWYSDYKSPFWADPGCVPGFEIYKWEKIQITCRWLVSGVSQ